MSNSRRTVRRSIGFAAVVIVTVLGLAGSALACGSLVAPNGAVRLVRTSTLAAYHDGVEHYVTSFQFAGTPTSFGSIVPLPAEPTSVERAGDWTLQRLEREVQPPIPESFQAASAPTTRADVEVLRQVRIDSLDLTILKGGGAAVASWAKEQGFALSDDAPDVLRFYARRSPYFMAAKFDADAAQAQGLTGGDGIPVHLTIPTREPWVPLHILATGKPGSEIVEADVFLLTDRRPGLLHGPGFTVERSERANDLLLNDLRSDKNSEWVPQRAWFTYGRVEAPASDLTYDLAIDASGHTPRLADTGVSSAALGLGGPGTGGGGGSWAGWLVVGLGAVTIGVGLIALTGTGRTPARARRTP
jgi:Uncharacterized protein conserved in bacteria (DUF2330)